MSGMDFFGQQDLARKKSTWLIVLFALAVLAITASVCAVLWFGLGLAETGHPHDYSALAVVALATPTLIGIAALTRMAQLRSGGSAVAAMLGGTEVAPSSDDAGHQQLRNVVEEMAIASGIPVPRIYVLEHEPGLNAFAAGWSTQDAAIAVTRGLLDALDRDQLQGVVAHEFSHIFHGDMRLNIRLMGVLFGIICIVEAGRVLLRTGSIGRRSDRKGNALPVLGLALMLIGAIGALFAGLIKAALSRQREYLADASAVTYTRNPRGIGTALARIADLHSGLAHPRAGEASHLYFADGMQRWFGGLTATHPPIEQRIERVLPGFLAAQRRDRGAEGLTATATATKVAEKLAPASAAIASLVGRADPAAVELARATLAHLPLDLLGAARDPSRVEGLIFALLRSNDLPPHMAPTSAATAHEARSLERDIEALPRSDRLALLELAIPALRRLPAAARQALLERSRAAIEHDAVITPFEFALWKIMQRHLSPPDRASRKLGGTSLSDAQDAEAIVLSVLAHAAGDEASAATAFTAGAELIEAGGRISLRPANACTIAALESALDRLATVTPFGKRQLLAACTRAAIADGVLRDDESELLRALSANFGCPLPPSLPRAAAN